MGCELGSECATSIGSPAVGVASAGCESKEVRRAASRGRPRRHSRHEQGEADVFLFVYSLLACDLRARPMCRAMYKHRRGEIDTPLLRAGGTFLLPDCHAEVAAAKTADPEAADIAVTVHCMQPLQFTSCIMYIGTIERVGI